jgi:lysophospholipase L1-like esterase
LAVTQDPNVYLLDLQAAANNIVTANSPDGIHPNYLGYQLITHNLLEPALSQFESGAKN